MGYKLIDVCHEYGFRDSNRQESASQNLSPMVVAPDIITGQTSDAVSEEAEIAAMSRKHRPVHVCWRFRTSHPWTVEEFQGRHEAYQRYFYLVDRGLEVEMHPNGSRVDKSK